MAMEKLTFGQDASGNPPTFEERTLRIQHERKKLKKSVVNNAGLMIGAMMVLVAIIFLTTDVHIGSFVDVVKIGVTTLMLLWCTYFTYVACSDSGTRAGLVSETYLAATASYKAAKEGFTALGYHTRLSEFCRSYVATELEEARRAILMDVDIPYELYLEKYIRRRWRDVWRDRELTRRQAIAIIRTNNTRPIHLTANMILPCSHAGRMRNPLGLSPEKKKRIQFAWKLFTSTLTSMFAAALIVDAILNPSWGMFVTVVIKVSMIILNGYFGYKFGFENVVVDTVHYMEGQQDLIRQAIEYCDTNKQTEAA